MGVVGTFWRSGFGFKNRVTNIPTNNALNFDEMDVLSVGFHLCGTMQLKAILGDSNVVANALAEIEKFTSERPSGFNTYLIPWPEAINDTKGFCLEKAGDITGARTSYLGHPSHFGYARFSVMCLANSQDVEAREWAYKAFSLEPKDGTALYVLAALLEREKLPILALFKYEEALTVISEHTQSQNRLLPFTVAEGAKVKSAIARLKSSSKPSP